MSLENQLSFEPVHCELGQYHVWTASILGWSVLQTSYTASLHSSPTPHYCRWPHFYVPTFFVFLLLAHFIIELPHTACSEKAVFPTSSFILTPYLTMTPHHAFQTPGNSKAWVQALPSTSTPTWTSTLQSSVKCRWLKFTELMLRREGTAETWRCPPSHGSSTTLDLEVCMQVLFLSSSLQGMLAGCSFLCPGVGLLKRFLFSLEC